MSRAHLQREIDKLKRQFLGLSAMVEEAVQKAVESATRRDSELARQVIAEDKGIDQREVDIEEECLKMLALYQPVAADLRLIVTILKMNDELERIADLAANIADRVLGLCELPPVPFAFEFETMADTVRWMLGRSIDSLVNLDVELAREVWIRDDEVDSLHREMYARVKAQLRDADETTIEALVNQMGISRFLERIADQSTSIAKDVLYMVDGEIVRHRGKEIKAGK